MSSCPGCAAPVAAHARFCGACGSPLPAGCPGCGADTLPGQAFCTDCGHALDDALGSGIGTGRDSGPALRRRADDRRPRTRGEERRIVSVLFVDVVGWTSAAEQLDPEDLRAAQSEYFAAVRAVVEQAGGTLEKYIGDAVLACFGAPRATENDPLRAVRAALRIQDVLAELRVGDSPLEARVGVATAEALVDLDADPARGQAFVTGDVVNLASRLQSAAPTGGVLVSRATYDATREAVEFEAVEPLTLKGKAEPAPAYLALSVVAATAVGPRHELPFVGRAPQLRLLESCLDRVVGDGAGALVSVTGEPGIGKSRLVHELRASRTEPPQAGALRWLSASCLSYDRQGSYAPLGALLREWVGDVPLEERLAAVVPPADAHRLAAALAPLLAPPDAAGGVRDARTDGRAVEAWRRVMVALAEDAPTVLVLEDLQRADDVLLDAVDELLALATEVPLLLIVTAWPELLERRPGWGAAGSDTVTLSLPPLDEEETVTLLYGLLGTDLPPAALTRLVALAGGNPLYAAECAGMLRDRAPAELVRGIPELPLPRSVQGLVASRLDLISPDERDVLHAASVLGESCWPGPVALLTGLPGSEVEVGLAQLARRGMLRRVRPSRVPGEPEYSFRSALVRELVYARLPRVRRLVQHTRAADWWAARPETPAPERHELVAHHRAVAAGLATALRSPDAGRRLEQARTALRDAAQRSYGLRALLPTRAHLEHALTLWPPDVDPVGRQSTLRMVEELAFLSDRDGFVAGGGAARVAGVAATLRVLEAPAEAARAHSLLGRIAWWADDRREALSQHAAAAELLTELPAGEQQALALTELARVQLLCRRAEDAIDTGRRAVALAERLAMPEAKADALCTVGVARYRSGDAGGLDDQERALETVRLGAPTALPRVAEALAATLQEEGELRRSYALMDEAFAAVTPGGAAGLASVQAEPEAVLRACSEGDWAQALALADDFLDAGADRSAAAQAQLNGLQAWLRLLRGQPAGPLLSALGTAVDQARAGGSPHVVAPVLAFAARCAALEGDTARARALHDEMWADRRGTAVPSRDWLPSAVATASYLDEQGDGEPADRLREALERVPHRTRWTRAALAGLASARARRTDDRDAALAAAEEAVAIYGDIGDETERGLAVSVAAARERELRGPGRWEWELAAFAARTGAVRLLSQTSPASQILGLVAEPPSEVVAEPPSEVVAEPPSEGVAEPPSEGVAEPPGEVTAD